jgi:hypothetical protein
MEAQEKLYFGKGDEGILDIYSNREFDDEVEYVRTDAFIEKATGWLEDHIYEYLKINKTWNEADYDPKLIWDFKKYMKEE